MARRHPSIPYMAQLDTTDCAAACLAMTLALHGRFVPLQDLREMTGAGRDGVSASRLISAASHFGLDAVGLRLEPGDVGQLSRGSILHWRMNHFVVLDRVDRTAVYIVDPALGKRGVSWEEFGRHFTGVAIEVRPGNGFERGGRPRKGGLTHLFKRIVADKPAWAAILSCTLVLQILGLGMPVILRAYVDRVLPNGQRQLVSVLGVVGVSIAVLFFMTALTRGLLLLFLRSRLGLRLSMDFLGHMLSLPFRFFFTRSSGDLLMRLNSTSVIRDFLTTATLSSVVDGLMAFSYTGLVLYQSAATGAVVCALALLQVIVLVLTRERYRATMGAYLESQAQTQAFLVQILAGGETIKASAAESHVLSHTEGLFSNEIQSAVRYGKAKELIDGTVELIRSAGPLILLWIGAHQVLNGTMSLGTMLAVNALGIGALRPFNSLIVTGFQLQLLQGYVDRISEILSESPEASTGDATVSQTLQGDIQLENVSFRYGFGDERAIRDVSVHIPAGSLTVIVGESGSGKSTLAYLVAGLLKPETGVVSIDGVPVDQYDHHSLRRQIGFVTQQSYLFRGSIFTNVALARPSIPIDRVAEACALACIDEEIQRMQMGYRTIIREGGVSLSAGQRQRLLLARALLDRPRLLLLDEATSDVDPATERRILENLQGMTCTRILITHRLENAYLADNVIVMKEGAVVDARGAGHAVSRDAEFARLLGRAGRRAPTRKATPASASRRARKKPSSAEKPLPARNPSESEHP